MTNQVDEMQKELTLLALEIQEIEFKMEELSKDIGKNESMLAFYDEVANRKTKRFLDLKIKIERNQNND
jgi:chromosome segregation ATPase